MESTYALAMWKMIEGGMKPKEAVSALHQLLIRLGRQNLLPKIGRAFSKIAQRDQSRTGITLSVAREKDVRKAHTEVKKVLLVHNIDPKEVKTHVDDSLIGGWRLEGREILLDSSFKKHLLSIYNHATQSQTS